MKLTGYKRGFTLLELLVVISLLSVGATMGLYIQNGVTAAWRAESTRNDLDRVAKNIFSQMRQDLAAAVSAKLSGAVITGAAGVAEHDRYHRVEFENDRFHIPAMLPLTDGKLQRAEVEYRVSRKDGRGALIRSVRVQGSPDPVEYEVAEGILAMRVEYADRQGWKTDWSGDSHPEAVRVSLVVMSPDSHWEQVSRRAVFPVHVN